MTEQEIIDAWANNMLEGATDEMDENGKDITPASLSEYFESEYELSFSPEEASTWLNSRDWYNR